MASEGEDRQDLSEGTHEPRECMACRGTGRVISQLGGSPSTVACPWCEGTGLRPAEIDAQTHWDEPGGGAAKGEAPSPAAAGEPKPAPPADGEGGSEAGVSEAP